MTQALIPLYCLTGFVGSGKTTVLLSILKQYPQKKIGVIFTEPAAYIKESDDISIECLESGSLKCTCEEEALPQALTYMRQCQPEMVFVEISGLSDPIHIKKILEKEENANALRRYDIQGIICLVDADNFMEQIQSVEMVKHQLSHCNMAVINKADLVSPELLSALQANIRRINPDCEIASCSFGGFNLVLLEHEMQRGIKESGVKRIRVHDLRHSHASMLIELGFSPLEIANRLGHEKVETTLNTYAHLYPNKQTKLAEQ